MKRIPVMPVLSALIGLLTLLVMAGCAILPQSKPKPLFVQFPVNQEAYFQAAFLAAQDFLTLKGYAVTLKKSYLVTLHEGESKVDGAWAWNVPKLGMCAGLTQNGKTLIVSQIGCKPGSRDEIRFCDAMHESLEYWALSNYGLTVHELAERDGWTL